MGALLCSEHAKSANNKNEGQLQERVLLRARELRRSQCLFRSLFILSAARTAYMTTYDVEESTRVGREKSKVDFVLCRR